MLAAVTFAGNTEPSPGFTYQMYAMLEYSAAYLDGGTTIAAWPWIPPPLVNWREAAFSVYISWAISMSARAEGSSILGKTGCGKPDTMASAVGIPWLIIVFLL